MLRNVVMGTVLLLAGTGLAKDARPSDEDMSGKKELQMANCPSAVAGSVTRVVDTAGGVELVITAKDPGMQDEIRKRAAKQVEVSWQPERGALEHTGLGTGSGKFGFCPGMVQETTVESSNLVDGVKLVVRTDRPEMVERLQQMTRQRVQALKKQRRGGER